MSQSKHSLRIVPITRSQMEFALGLRVGLFNTRSPSRLIDSSNSTEKMASRSCSRYSYRFFVSHRLAQLLPRPLRRRMCRYVEVNESAAVVFHDDQYV